jgi:hypothetical protein
LTHDVINMVEHSATTEKEHSPFGWKFIFSIVLFFLVNNNASSEAVQRYEKR